jgi:hypothetical protein
MIECTSCAEAWFAPPETPHVLVILEQGEDYEVEHDPHCATVHRWTYPNGQKIMDYNCLVAAALEAGWEYASCDPDTEGWKHLPVGRYVLTGWTEHTPSLPTNGGEEWDYGAHIGPRC